MALRNLHALANRYISGAVNPNLTGSWISSAGYTALGDAQITGAISAGTLTVSAVASGALAIGSLLTDTTFALAPATTVTGFGSGSGGPGTYAVSPAQEVTSEAMTANGPGARSAQTQVFSGIPMQFQAVSGQDLEHVDALNLQRTSRVVYMNGQAQGVQRPDAKGGDVLLAPTGLSGAPNDTWLVIAVLEGWDASGWCKVAVVLQLPSQAQ